MKDYATTCFYYYTLLVLDSSPPLRQIYTITFTDHNKIQDFFKGV